MTGPGIWRYCMNKQEWSQLYNSSQFPYTCVSSTLTSNENYIIMHGVSLSTSIGTGSIRRVYLPNNKLFVLDLRIVDNYELKECGIRCPRISSANIVAMGNNQRDMILITGWIRELYKQCEFKGLSFPPICIRQLITSWFNQETLHWISTQTDEHYAINLKHIYSSIS